MRYGTVGTTVLALLLMGATSTGCAASNATKGTTQLVVSNPGDTGIAVDGHGEISAAPDMATLSLGVEARAKTAADARAQAADDASKVITSLKANGIAAKDIQTERFSIEPHYEQQGPDHAMRIVGYDVSNAVSAKVHDLSRVSHIVDEAADAGGDNVRVNGIMFSIEDAAKARAEARERAVADARSKAEQLAKLTGVTLDAPIAVEEVSFRSPVWNMSRAEAAASPTPIEPGENLVSLDVRVRWAMHG